MVQCILGWQPFNRLRHSTRMGRVGRTLALAFAGAFFSLSGYAGKVALQRAKLVGEAIRERPAFAQIRDLAMARAKPLAPGRAK